MKRALNLVVMALAIALGQAVLGFAEDPPPKTGEKQDTLLYVRTIPPGAKVLLDGRKLGTSDGVFYVEPGIGTIVVEMEGRKSNSKKVTIRSDGITRVTLTLAKSGGAESASPLPQDTVEPVFTTVGVNYFKEGDFINITDVKATSPDLKNGDKVIVKGYYTLASQPKASLCLFATATTGSGTSEIRSGQTIGITKGRGEFELFETLDCDGYLHVTFYSVPGGKPFGGLYFGTAKQMKAVKHWDVQSWYTTDSAVAQNSNNDRQSELTSADEEAAGGSEKPAAEKVVVEGVGWEGFRVGATPDELIKAYGPFEPNPYPNSVRKGWLSKHHIDFYFDQENRAAEVRFVEGFKLPLASGVKIGSSEKEVLLAYGAPDRVVNKPRAKMLEYDNRGVLMWLMDGKVTSFTVCKPHETPENLSQTPAMLEKNTPSANGGNASQLTQQGWRLWKKRQWDEAAEAAKIWLALVDKGEYGQSWETAAAYLQKAVTKDKFVHSLEAVRKPLGEMKSRKLKSRKFTTALPGAPDGQYVILQYETSFANKDSAVETITPMLDTDGEWKISGYFIK